MKVESIMTTQVVTISQDKHLSAIKDIFEKNRFHHLLVENAGKLVGVISDRDLLRHLSPYVGTAEVTVRDVKDLTKSAKEIMTSTLVTVTPDMTIKEAGSILLDKSISCLPVVDESMKILGIMTWKDLLRATLLDMDDF